MFGFFIPTESPDIGHSALLRIQHADVHVFHAEVAIDYGGLDMEISVAARHKKLYVIGLYFNNYQQVKNKTDQE